MKPEKLSIMRLCPLHRAGGEPKREIRKRIKVEKRNTGAR